MKITRSHDLGLDEVRQRVTALADSLCSQYSLQSSWRGDELEISGSGVSGKIAVAEQSVDVDVKLGFALKMLESTIRSSIESAMDKHLG